MPLTATAAARKDRTDKATTMTHRHFVVIAKAIRAAPLTLEARKALAEHFRAELSSTNPAFDGLRFVLACDPTIPA